MQGADESDPHGEEQEEEDDDQEGGDSSSGASSESEKGEKGADEKEQENQAATERKEAMNEAKYDTPVGEVSTTPPEVSFKISTKEPFCLSAIFVLLALTHFGLH